MIDSKECEHLIGVVAADLADTTSDPTLPEGWCKGWDAALVEYAEPLAEQLREALAEIDALTVARNADRTEWMTTYATMRALLDEHIHEDVAAFVDGELSPERAAAFRDHLAQCQACEQMLLGRLQETAVVSSGAERRDAVCDAAVAWVRAGGTLAALTAAVNAMEDGNG